jgi:carbon-monoxide dehydrogenase small subunit
VGDTRLEISYRVNGRPVRSSVDVRTTLLDHVRDELRLHGTHVGCEHGVCGCCNVTLDGDVVRSCLMLAYQVDGHDLGTIEGIEGPDGSLSPLQQAFCDHHAMQCGYCTPGIIISLEALLAERPEPTDDELVDALSGNLCRCTGYQQILEAARAVVGRAGPDHAGGELEPSARRQP